ncbi:lacZ [Symbiodinium sp. CCMP2592]|nr:lacZ [Symbiodinium sp. CCMP2592]
MAPPGGVLCNRQIVDSHAWSAKKVSKFELQELWSHVLKDRKVLVVIGSALQVDALEPILHLAAGAAVYFVRDAELEDLSGLLETLRRHSADFNTVLLAIGSRSSALLSAGLDCTVQTLDVGALRISPAPRQQPVPSPLTTANADSQAAWASFPRPHLKRSADWQSLNGKWAVHISTRDQEMPPEDFEDGFLEVPWSPSEGTSTLCEKSKVPFPAESHRGGLQRRISEYELLWLRREVSLPSDWRRVLLHVDACDWECAVFADGSLLGIHRGGYDPFMFELAVHGGKDTVQLTIRVWDPTDSGCEYAVDDDQPPRCDQCCQTGWQPRGKQSLQPGFIMYSAASGPWQSIWLEEAPEGCLIASAAAELLDEKRIRFEVDLTEQRFCVGIFLQVAVFLEGAKIAEGSGSTEAAEVVGPEPWELWSPTKPTLHMAKLSLCSSMRSTCGDSVDFKFALRMISRTAEPHQGPKGEVALLLNGEAYLQSPLPGLLAGVSYHPTKRRGYSAGPAFHQEQWLQHGAGSCSCPACHVLPLLRFGGPSRLAGKGRWHPCSWMKSIGRTSRAPTSGRSCRPSLAGSVASAASSAGCPSTRLGGSFRRCRWFDGSAALGERDGLTWQADGTTWVTFSQEKMPEIWWTRTITRPRRTTGCEVLSSFGRCL